MTAFLAPNGKFYVFTKCGQPAVGGFMITQDAITGAPKNTYSDPSMTIPNPPRMRVGSDGAVEFTLFWDTSTSFYNYKTFDSSGALIDEQFNYPITNGGGSSPPVTVIAGSENFAQNEQYNFWNFGTSFDNSTLPIGTTVTADMWVFTRSNLNATIFISRFSLPAGYTGVPFSPTYAYRYQVTATSSDPTQDHGQRYKDVNTLSNKIVFRGNYMSTNVIGSTASVSLYVKQNFGLGGSAQVETVIATFTVTDTPDFYFLSFTIPDVSTKVIGSNSFVEIGWRLNPAQIQDLLIFNEQFQKGQGTGILYPYTTNNLQYEKILSTEIKGNDPNTGTDIIGIGSLISPPPATETLTDFLSILYAQSNVKEYLPAWSFPLNPNQLGDVILSINDGQYIADQTILVSDGNGVVSKINILGEDLILEILQTSLKFGIFTIIEEKDSFFLNNSVVSLLASINPSAGTSTYKIAVLAWNGTSRAELRKCVSLWNAPGTLPTLATGWSYAAGIGSESITSSISHGFLKLNNQSLLSAKTYGVLVWCDSANVPVGQNVAFQQVSLTNGQRARENQGYNFQQVLAYCNRYIYRSYNLEIKNGTSTNTSGYCFTPLSGASQLPSSNPNSLYPATLSGGGYVATSSGIYTVNLPVTMYKNPDVNIYNPSISNLTGSGYLSVVSTTIPIAGSLLIPLYIGDSTENNFNIVYSQGLLEYPLDTFIEYSPNIYINFVAYALLGV